MASFLTYKPHDPEPATKSCALTYRDLPGLYFARICIALLETRALFSYRKRPRIREGLSANLFHHFDVEDPGAHPRHPFKNDEGHVALVQTSTRLSQ